MAKIIIGPTGIGSYAESERNLENYAKLGFRAAEILFTYQVYLKKEEAIQIEKIAKKHDIKLSIHAPYYINLNSQEEKKANESIKRILDSCEIGHFVGAENIIIHPGFYSNLDTQKARENIKRRIVEIMKTIKQKGWNVKLCVETMGKRNVFGSIEEVSWLVNETGCSFCIDFAHILARYGSYNFDEIEKSFPQKSWQCHFSGINYGDKGERNHISTKKEDWKNLFNFLKNLNKEVTIINESPTPIEDCIEGLEILKEFKH